MKKWWIWMMAPLLLLAERPSVEQLFNVTTVKVKKEVTAYEKRLYGFLQVDERRIADVTPRFGGYVVTLYVDRIYEPVKRGMPLAKVYSPEVFKAKEEYLNALRYAKRQGQTGMAESARRKLELLGIGKSEIERCRKTGRADPYTHIYAPRGGVIFEKRLFRGSAFKAGEKIFRIVGLDELVVETKVDEKDLSAVMSAAGFTVTTRAVKGRFKGRNPYLYPEIDRKEALATLRLDIANPDGFLFPGMLVDISARGISAERLVLPRTAVIRKMGRWYLFKAGEFEGEYEPVEVTVEPLDDRRYAILSGVSEGDTVVNNALFLIDSDAQINGLY